MKIPEHYKSKLWKFYLGEELQGTYTSLQVMGAMHEIVYASKFRVVQIALIIDTEHDAILTEKGEIEEAI